MKNRLVQFVILGVLILMLAVAISQINLIPAKASLGNQGIPVRCYISGSVTAGTSQFMTCVSAAAPYFVSSQRVPSGYYFLVTDVFVTPATGGTGDTPVGFYLYDAYGTSSRASSYVFRSVDGASYGQHFIVPLYVLTADHRLEVQAFGGNATSFEIRITGLLVNSVTYLPMLYNNP